jgi:hypothetical protein
VLTIEEVLPARENVGSPLALDQRATAEAHLIAAVAARKAQELECIAGYRRSAGLQPDPEVEDGDVVEFAKAKKAVQLCRHDIYDIARDTLPNRI